MTKRQKIVHIVITTMFMLLGIGILALYVGHSHAAEPIIIYDTDPLFGVSGDDVILIQDGFGTVGDQVILADQPVLLTEEDLGDPVEESGFEEFELTEPAEDREE